MGWKNFQMWRGRLPHWRADDVTYYATFNHRRDLSEDEMQALFSELLKRLARNLSVLVLAVTPTTTEMLFREKGKDFTDLLEKAKAKAGKLIVAKSGERWPPFGGESYDRIIRDEVEYEEYLTRIVETCAEQPFEDELGDYPFVWVDPDSAFMPQA